MARARDFPIFEEIAGTLCNFRAAASVAKICEFKGEKGGKLAFLTTLLIDRWLYRYVSLRCTERNTRIKIIRTLAKITM